jgi:hypothetical protein
LGVGVGGGLLITLDSLDSELGFLLVVLEVVLEVLVEDVVELLVVLEDAVVLLVELGILLIGLGFAGGVIPCRSEACHRIGIPSAKTVVGVASVVVRIVDADV